MVDECSSRYPIAECIAATMEKLHEFEKVQYQIVAWSRESADRLIINLGRRKETSVYADQVESKLIKESLRSMYVADLQVLISHLLLCTNHWKCRQHLGVYSWSIEEIRCQ